MVACLNAFVIMVLIILLRISRRIWEFEIEKHLICGSENTGKWNQTGVMDKGGRQRCWQHMTEFDNNGKLLLSISHLPDTILIANLQCLILMKTFEEGTVTFSIYQWGNQGTETLSLVWGHAAEAGFDPKQWTSRRCVRNPSPATYTTSHLCTVDKVFGALWPQDDDWDDDHNNSNDNCFVCVTGWLSEPFQVMTINTFVI